MLAADRAPAGLTEERVAWLASAVETAAPGNHADLAYRALDDCDVARRTRAAGPGPARTGRAGRHRRSAIEEVLTAAFTDAGDDAALVATSCCSGPGCI